MMASTAMMTDEGKASEQQQLLRFAVQDIDCCIPLHHIEQVLPLMALQSVPAAPDYLVGLLNLHGTSVPVMDAGIRLGLDMPEPYDENTPLLLCTDGDRRFGLIVTQVEGVESVSADDLQMRSDFKGIRAPLMAVIETGERLSLVLDLPAIMDIDLSMHSENLLSRPPG